MTRFLICGLGSIGRRHLRNLIALGERDINLLRSHQSTLPDDELAGYPVYTDLTSALSAGPQAVIISNPTALHLDVAIPAAAAGCHLLLEKPVSDSLDRVAALQHALAQGGGKVLVGFQFRFHPGLNKIAQLLGEEKIGRPLTARAHWGEYLPAWHPWEDYRRGYSARADLGGGVTLTLSHPLDYLYWLFGEIQSLWAFTARLGELELEVEDTAEIGLRFSSGVLASVHLDYNQRPVSHHLEIVGTHGTLRWDNATGTVKLHSAHANQPDWREFPLPEPEPGRSFDRNDLFLAEMAHFLDLVEGRAESRCSLEAGIQSLTLALAAHQSAASGRRVDFPQQKTF